MGFRDHLVIKVLDYMEVLEYRLNVRALILKCLLEVRVHVGGDSFNTVHPFGVNVLYEVVDDLLALSIGNPEFMTGLQVDDLRGLAVAVMELELVDA